MAIERIGESESPARTRRCPILQANTASAVATPTPKTIRRGTDFDMTGRASSAGVAWDSRADRAVGPGDGKTLTCPTNR